MKTILAIILTALLALVLGEYLPWWSVAIAAFAISLFIRQRTLGAFLGGFLGVAIAWAGYAFWIDDANSSLLSARISFVLPFQGNVILLILFTGLIGGIVGGLAATSANFLVQPGKRNLDHQNYYRKK